MKTIQDTLDYILKSITPDSEVDQIKVESRDENGIQILEISAPAETIGQIIGKEGRIIKSIRSLLGAAYPNLKFNVLIKE